MPSKAAPRSILFARDMPRLSVDIDLTYLPVAGRTESLAAIDAGMKRMAVAIGKGIPGVKVNEVVNRAEGIVTKLTLQRADTQIKIEVTPVLRGCVFDPEMRSVRPNVEETFGFAETQVVSFSDLYAGKLVAALDRQHARDLEGMTSDPVSLDELLKAREDLITEVSGKMPKEHREFLIGFKLGKPDWALLGVDGAAELPAARWKQINLDKLRAADRQKLVVQLIAVLK